MVLRLWLSPRGFVLTGEHDTAAVSEATRRAGHKAALSAGIPRKCTAKPTKAVGSGIFGSYLRAVDIARYRAPSGLSAIACRVRTETSGWRHRAGTGQTAAIDSGNEGAMMNLGL
jgi:hypothetical protein